MQKRSPNPSPPSLEELKRRGNKTMAEARKTIQQAHEIMSTANKHEAAVASARASRPAPRQKFLNT